MDLNLGHIRTVRGLLQIAQVAFGILMLICVGACACYRATGAANWLYFVGIVGFLASAAFLLLFLLRMPARINKIPFALIGLGFTAAWGALYFICFIVACVTSSKHRAEEQFYNTHSAMGAAAFFCLLATAAYGADAFFYLKDHRGGGLRDQEAGVPPAGIGGGGMPPPQPAEMPPPNPQY